MAAKRLHVTDTELSVLQVLWQRQVATTREICDELYPNGGAAQYYTVQKLLERLESRECVERDRSARVHTFRATVDRDSLIKERLRELSDSLCGGDVLPMLTGLIHLRRWTPSEQKQLEKFLNELGSEPKPSKKRGAKRGKA